MIMNRKYGPHLYRFKHALLLALLGLIHAHTQARSLSEIIKSKELRVCVVAYHPDFIRAEPENCRGNCKFSGLVFEEIQVFSKFLGPQIQAKFLRLDWDEQFFNKNSEVVRNGIYTPELLASGKCDVYPNNLTRNEWRLKKLDIIYLFPSRMMAIVNKSKQKEYKNLHDLAGKIAAVDKDTSYHTWLGEQNQTGFKENPVKIQIISTHESFVAVDSGKVDFTLADSDLAISATQHELKNSSVSFPVGPTEEIGWGFRKQDRDLQAAAQRFFEDQKERENSEFNQLWKKHFGINLIKFIALVKSTP
ncbi:transporter substrate-binding domain-containing protein [Undibacterium parvum]|uniref:Transporter substrate-binding domain-containing protein n=2 Tax=Undibacterium parvum TaxID=401471 RepID=A0A3S9HFT9_9BURK|nr:transporter substrate-binding domain-containing protein [Undibacterium parvum]